jgi:hypothetical protein
MQKNMTVGSFFKIFKENKDENGFNHFLHIAIANMSFVIYPEDKVDHVIPNEVYNIPVAFQELVKDEELGSYGRWVIPEGSKEYFLKFCKYDPEKNPFVITI